MTIALMAQAFDGPVATMEGFRSCLSIHTAYLSHVAVHLRLPKELCCEVGCIALDMMRVSGFISC
jgi:hypothetical protein